MKIITLPDSILKLTIRNLGGDHQFTVLLFYDHLFQYSSVFEFEAVDIHQQNQHFSKYR